MHNYKTNDKIILRDDLVSGEWYGNYMWTDEKEISKDKMFLNIEFKDSESGVYVADGLMVTEDMIFGLYEGGDM